MLTYNSMDGFLYLWGDYPLSLLISARSEFGCSGLEQTVDKKSDKKVHNGSSFLALLDDLQNVVERRSTFGSYGSPVLSLEYPLIN